MGTTSSYVLSRLKHLLLPTILHIRFRAGTELSYPMESQLSGLFFNTVLIRKLPLFEGIVVVLHIFGFFAFFLVLWVMAPRSDHKAVFTGFQVTSGFSDWLLP
jgi:choline transport protein